jgi:type I restriction enzyme, S subunit
MPYVGLENVEPHTMRLIGHGSAADVRSSCLRFSVDDVLYGRMRPYLNKVWVAEFEGLCSAEFIVFPKREEITSAFLAAQLNSEDFVVFANGQVSGERPRVDFDKLSSFPILLPPAAEQNRITARLDVAVSAIRRAETASTRARERLERYRTAVLRAAVTGDLTDSWREKHAQGTQTGNAVLGQLISARRNRQGKPQLKLFQDKEPTPSNVARKSRDPEPSKPDIELMPEIPKSWTWASLGMVADVGTGIFVSQNRKVENPVSLPYLRVANVLRGSLDLSDVKSMKVEKQRAADYLLHVGDVLFTEGGDRDKLGRGWVWEGKIDMCVHQNHVFRARPFDPSLVNPKLLSHWGNTFGQEFFLKYGKQTTNLASINRGVLSRLPVPVAPVEEQSEILREIERRVASAEKLSATLDMQQKRARMTRQTLLSDAFSGRLLPQNPDDEPADALIERSRAIRIAADAEREQLEKSNRSTGTKGSDSMRESSPTSESLIHCCPAL